MQVWCLLIVLLLFTNINTEFSLLVYLKVTLDDLLSSIDTGKMESLKNMNITKF
jgi:hypothetical protein